MKWMVVTSPAGFAGEVLFWRQVVEAGADALHLRRPDGGRAAYEGLLRQLPADVRRRVVLHDCFELAAAYGVGGVHLNRRNPIPPAGWTGRISASCHSLDEVERRKAEGLDYVWLSPVFNSISKPGYGAAFTPQELDAAAAQGIIDERVMALGGVEPASAPLLRRWHFGGGVMLGAVARLAQLPAWDRAELLRRIRQQW